MNEDAIKELVAALLEAIEIAQDWYEECRGDRELDSVDRLRSIAKKYQ